MNYISSLTCEENKKLISEVIPKFDLTTRKTNLGTLSPEKLIELGKKWALIFVYALSSFKLQKSKSQTKDNVKSALTLDTTSEKNKNIIKKVMRLPNNTQIINEKLIFIIIF